MASKHICPVCGGTEFITIAHITQTWVVDQEGNFLSAVSDCDEVTHEPDDGNIWTCTQCGAEGVIVED